MTNSNDRLDLIEQIQESTARAIAVNTKANREDIAELTQNVNQLTNNVNITMEKLDQILEKLNGN